MLRDCYKHRPVRHPDIPDHGNGVVLLVVLEASWLPSLSARSKVALFRSLSQGCLSPNPSPCAKQDWGCWRAVAEVKEGKWVPRVSPLLRRAVPAQDSPWHETVWWQGRPAPSSAPLHFGKVMQEKGLVGSCSSAEPPLSLSHCCTGTGMWVGVIQDCFTSCYCTSWNMLESLIKML